MHGKWWGPVTDFAPGPRSFKWSLWSYMMIPKKERSIASINYCLTTNIFYSTSNFIIGCINLHLMRYILHCVAHFYSIYSLRLVNKHININKGKGCDITWFYDVTKHETWLYKVWITADAHLISHVKLDCLMVLLFSLGFSKSFMFCSEPRSLRTHKHLILNTLWHTTSKTADRPLSHCCQVPLWIQRGRRKSKFGNFAKALLLQVPDFQFYFL